MTVDVVLRCRLLHSCYCAPLIFYFYCFDSPNPHLMCNSVRMRLYLLNEKTNEIGLPLQSLKVGLAN
jgi:hypothetical protein